MKINRSFEIRAISDDSRTIEGQAIVFNSYSRDLGGFVERIEPTAITEDELASYDIIANYNHDNNQMLARYNKGEGTLELELREDGLYFRFECPTTAFGDEILYHVRHKDIYECSFAAIISKDHIKRYKEGDTYIQVINKIDNILDVSLVNRAAYPDTSVSARSEEEAKNEFEDIKNEVEQAEIERKAAEEAENERKQEILNSLDNKLSEFYKNISI